jgi:hypothetical protein
MKLFYFYTITNNLSLRDCVNLLKLNKSTTSKILFIKDNQIIKLNSLLELFLSKLSDSLLLITIYGNEEDNRNCFYQLKKILEK